MPPLQDGEAFWGGLSTGVTRGYYHPAPLGRNIRGGVNDPCGGADAYGRLTWASFVSEANGAPGDWCNTECIYEVHSRRVNGAGCLRSPVPKS
jgi:hypothetical protein